MPSAITTGGRAAQSAALIRPHPTIDYKCSQSKHENVPELPTRMICVAPSGSGKTVLIISLLLDIYPAASSESISSAPRSMWIDSGMLSRNSRRRK